MGVSYKAIYKVTYVVSYIPVALFLGGRGGGGVYIYNTTHALKKLETVIFLFFPSLITRIGLTN